MRRFLATIACLLVFPAFVLGQTETATFSGRVTDQTGAVVKGAEVILRNADTGVEFPSKTNESGLFVYPGMEPGKYVLTVRAKGFSEVIDQGITLHVQDRVEQNITLKVGSANERVVVNANALIINTQDGSVGTVIDRQFIENIPLNGRTMQGLIELTPGVVITRDPAAGTQGQFSVDGQRQESNSFTVDGVSANIGANQAGAGNLSVSGNLPNVTATGTTQPLASLDDIQEFKVQTSSYSAENGTRPGGQIAVATRGGTNLYHGTLFDYLRNTYFDGNDWFANRNATNVSPATHAIRPPEHQNDFGGTFGGPVRIPGIYNGKDKTFFFFNYEGLRLQLPNFLLTDVPDLCLRGKAPASGATSCAGVNSQFGLTGATEATKPLVPAPVATQAILNAWPLPNGVEDAGTGQAIFASSYSNPSNIDSWSVRVDENLTSKLTVFARYFRSPSSSTTLGNDLANPTILGLQTQGLTVGSTWVLTPKMTNDVRFNYSQNTNMASETLTTFGGATPPAISALIPSQYNTGAGTSFSIDLLLPSRQAANVTFFDLQTPFLNSMHQWELVDGLSYLKGKHQFKFGLDYRHLAPNLAINQYTIFQEFLDADQVNGTCAPPLGTITCGGVTTAPFGTVASGVSRAPLFQNIALYAQDDWKLTRRLTVNLGLRWEVNPAPSQRDGRTLIAVNQITNFASMALAPTGTPEWHTTYKNFAPRLGVAYQLIQKPGWETVVRGGFGMFYDTGNNAAGQALGFPYGASTSITNMTYPYTAAQIVPATVPISLTPPATGFPNLFLFDPNLQLPFTYQWNLAVEQAIGKSQSLTATYVGNHSVRLLQDNTYSIHTVNPTFSNISLNVNNATSDYDALQVQFQRRMSHGLQAMASYSWSHALDWDSSSFTGFAPLRGNAAFDIRQVASAAMTYDAPAPTNNNVVRYILGHWSIDNIFHVQSAPPVDIKSAGSILNPVQGSVTVRPIIVPGIPLYVSKAQCLQNYNGRTPAPPQVTAIPGGGCINNQQNDITLAQATAAGCLLNAAKTAASTAIGPFCAPPTGTTGNLGRNQLRALGAWQLDTAVQRVFPIHERLSLLFRAEAFNVFNHPNFGSPQALISSTTFGQETSELNNALGGGLNALYQLGAPRSMQFALKFRF